jgi:hypothetical protein
VAALKADFFMRLAKGSLNAIPVSWLDATAGQGHLPCMMSHGRTSFGKQKATSPSQRNEHRGISNRTIDPAATITLQRSMPDAVA